LAEPSIALIQSIIMSTIESRVLSMPAKEQVRAMLDALPSDCTIEDVQYGLYVLEKIRRGIEELDRGEGIPHEEVKRQMEKWLTK
jgi:predicted transcriptional regulator